MKIDCVGHIKTLKLKRELNIPRWQAVGLLETLFNFAMVNADDGGIGRYSNDEISLYMEYFGDADELISALTKSGFIEECKQHRLKLHDWAEHAPKFLKDRLAKRALAKGSEPERTDATESDIEQPDANDARCSVEIGLSKVKHSNATSLKSNPSSGESWEIDPGDAPTDEMLLQLIADWNEVAAKHPRRITQRRSKQITPKLRRQVSQLPDDWFSRYREALAQLPVPCFDYDGGFRANFDWFVQPDKRERTVAYNILDGVYDFVPADAKDAREKQLDRQNQAAQKKRRGQMDRETMLYRQIQALIRTGKADSAECERLKKEYAEVCDGS